MAGCASSAGRVPAAVITYSEGAPPGHTPAPWPSPGLPPPEAVWNGPNLMYIVVWGSSGCPRLPTSVKGSGRGRVIVTTTVVNLSHSDACAADAVADTSTIRVPSSIDTTGPVAVTIDGTTVTLGPPGG